MKRLLIVGFLCIAAMPGAEIAGTWIGEIPNTTAAGVARGTYQEVAFKFIQNGTTVTGKLYGDYQSSPIIEGKITGDEIDVVVIAQEQQGNQITNTRLRFAGRVKQSGEIEMTRVRESATNAVNGGDYKFKVDNVKRTFLLKRLP